MGWLQKTVLIRRENETSNTIHSSKKDLRDLDYVNKLEVLEGTFKRECQDYPTKEDCLVCCN